MAKKKNTPKTKVESIRHADKRKNIPTEELRDFVAEDENAPKTMLYPRDPSLDPQLVWKGKDEQDRKDLAVPVVPIYIQEKIHPQALIEDLLARNPKANGVREASAGYAEQINLFADFNGLPEEFERRVDFYSYDANWQNRFILGDSLLVMTSLAEKEGLKGKVQCLYFDPPYGIKFGSNWQVSTRKRDIRDGKAEDATRQPEQIRAFRDTWKLGIHSYLAYLRDRLVGARELLTETGSVFVQIGDENVHLVRCVLDEIFGADNFCSLISFRKTSAVSSPMARVNILGGVCDMLVWYAKSKEHVKYRQLYLEKTVESDVAGVYAWVELADGTRRRMNANEKGGVESIPQGSKVFRVDNVTSAGWSEKLSASTTLDGTKYEAGENRHWATHSDGMNKLASVRRLVPAGKSLGYVRFIDDFAVYPVVNNWTDTGTGSFTDEKVYVVQTGAKVIERCLLMTTDPGDLVLDPTCGSGTTAYVAEQWGRRWITVDTSRVALALARTRLMGGRFPYYYLADSPEGAAKEAEVTGARPPATQTGSDVRKGFVYKRVPHVTLKSIANNPDIKAGMTREQIDAAIARHADTEMLYNQPYEDSKRVRVAGPFTVESLSPHRVLEADKERPASEREGERDSSDFALMIIENLFKAGVQNTKKKERLAFEALNSHAGVWIHATGTYQEGGKTKRVAVSVGPEHGTVGPQQVKEAAKEAVQGVGYDLLIVCGFAFDPHVGEEVKRYGELNVLPTKMNPDLAMGDELLKKTGAGNLFMVFGEPDIRPVHEETGKLLPQKDGTYVVEIKGVDVYDPTTGSIRSSSTDDIACWFLDTEYNGESFFVRHAYFTGADEPYDKLKRALRAEIDEAAWSALYSTKSQPFPKPATGKIAIKVINHYGDEVLKVLSV